MPSSFHGSLEALVTQIGGRGVAEAAAVPDRDHHTGVVRGEDRLEFVAANPEVFRAFVVQSGGCEVDIGRQRTADPLLQRLRLDEHVGHRCRLRGVTVERHTVEGMDLAARTAQLFAIFESQEFDGLEALVAPGVITKQNSNSELDLAGLKAFVQGLKNDG